MQGLNIAPGVAARQFAPGFWDAEQLAHRRAGVHFSHA